MFTYNAVREDGTSVSDEAMASGAGELRQELAARGYLVLSVQKKRVRIGGGDLKPKDFLIFNQEFSTLVKAGLPILQALEILKKRTEHKGFHNTLESIVQEIKGGSMLSDAMALHPSYFPTLYTATVQAGEKSGALVEVLRRFIDYQKRMLAVRRKLTTALAYPVFLVIALSAVMVLFFLYIIPNFTQMYSDQEAALPLLTTLLISLTEGLTSYAPALFLSAVLAGIGLYLLQKTATGKRILDNVKLKIPFVNTLLLQYILAQLARTLATVLRGGIPLIQAIDTTAGVIGNSVIAAKLSESRKLVTEGISLADAFDRTRLAPDMTIRMIEVGESSGDLPQMLEEVSDFYEQEVENKLTALTTLIEPVLMLGMGLVIAFIVLALYLPIFEMGARY